MIWSSPLLQAMSGLLMGSLVWRVSSPQPKYTSCSHLRKVMDSLERLPALTLSLGGSVDAGSQCVSLAFNDNSNVLIADNPACV